MRDIHYRIHNLDVNGKIRPITLYSKYDLTEQKELYRRYSREFLNNTHKAVYSFIPGFSNFDAAVLSCYQANFYRYFIKLDIHEYYPHINRVMASEALHRFLPQYTAERICRYAFCCPKGISEGSPLSPAISNVYLYNFDDQTDAFPGSFYIRYCDDILLLMNLNPEPYIQYIKDALRAHRLSINQDKVSIGCIEEGFNFVGYYIRPEDICVLYENVAAITNKINAAADDRERSRIANGFRAYYRDARCLPLCGECIDFLLRYGSTKEKSLFEQKYGIDILSIARSLR